MAACQPSWDPWTSITTKLQDYGAEVELVLKKIISQPKTGFFCGDFAVFQRFLPNDLDRKMKACIAPKATTLRLECLSYSFKGFVAAPMYRPSSSNKMNTVSFMLFQKVSHMVYQQWTHSNVICRDCHYISKAISENSNLVGAVFYRKLQAAHWFFGFAVGVRQVIMRHYSGWTLCRRPKGATGPAHWDVLRDTLWSSVWKCLIQNVHNLRINTYL